jgi:hypothetical protein
LKGVERNVQSFNRGVADFQADSRGFRRENREKGWSCLDESQIPLAAAVGNRSPTIKPAIKIDGSATTTISTTKVGIVP